MELIDQAVAIASQHGYAWMLLAVFFAGLLLGERR